MQTSKQSTAPFKTPFFTSTRRSLEEFQIAKPVAKKDLPKQLPTLNPTTEAGKMFKTPGKGLSQQITPLDFVT